MADAIAVRGIDVLTRDSMMPTGPVRDQRFEWRASDYPAWNRLLLGYFLDLDRRGRAVDRIPATPEELIAVVGDRGVDAEEVTSAFAAAVRDQLPPGVSFCRYCLTYRTWTPTSAEPPHFFGMLWFTCLLAAGYPERPGSFRERFRALIGTDDQLRFGRDQRGCLNKLWEDLATWSSHHPGFAELLLPPEDDHLVVIGRSYYLAFPNRRDRRALEAALRADELVGFEPPILPVVRAVQRARDSFSADFRQALDHFLERFLRGGRDPRDSAFWRAIRTEALHSQTPPYSGAPVGPMTLLATWDDDETLLVRAACIATHQARGMRGMEMLPLPVPVGNVTHYLVDDSGDPDLIVEEVLASSIDLPRGLWALVRQGVLVFQEDLAGEYRLVTGEEVNGAEVALVRRCVSMEMRHRA